MINDVQSTGKSCFAPRRSIYHCQANLDASVKELKINVSGCFNSCGQHCVADLEFYGVSRKVGTQAVPHFQAVLRTGTAPGGKEAAVELHAITLCPMYQRPVTLGNVGDEAGADDADPVGVTSSVAPFNSVQGDHL